MKCEYCKSGHYPVCTHVKERLPGGFAEYVRVPGPLVEKGIYRLPDHITDDQSTFIEPLACAIRAQRLAAVQKNQSVLVLGSGMSGLLHVKLAKSNQCRVIVTDVNPKRLEFARHLGADLTINAAEKVPERLADANNGLCDVVILCTSAIAAVEQAWKCVDKGGVIVFYAVPHPDKKITIPINAFWTREIRVITSYYCGPPDIEAALSLMETEAIKTDDLTTRQLPLGDITRGFQMLLQGEEALKVIIKPHL
jgi:L-iditol 2-dehydrogenase